MQVSFDLMVQILIASCVIHCALLILQAVSFKDTSTTSLWIFALVLQLLAFINLSETPLNGIASWNGLIIFVSLFSYLVGDLLRIIAMEKNFKKEPKLSVHAFLLVVYGLVLAWVFFGLENIHLVVDITLIFRVLNMVLAYVIIVKNKAHSLWFSRIVLVTVYGVGIVVNAVLLIYNGHELHFYMFQEPNPHLVTIVLIESLVWLFVVIALNVNQLKVDSKNNLIMYEALFETSPDAQFMVEGDSYVFVQVNETFAEYVNIPSEELVGRSVMDVEIFKDQQLVLKDFKSKIDVALNGSAEIRATRLDGIEYVGLWSAKRLEGKGGSNLYMNSLKNVSEVNQFKRINQMLNSVVNQNPMAVVVTDTDGNIEYVNDRFTKMTGFTLEDALGNTPRIMKSGLNDLAYYESLWETIIRGEEWRDIIRNKRKDGTLYWEDLKIVPVKDELGRNIAYLGMKEDVTLRKEREDALEVKAYTDALTGIYNRGFFVDYFDALISQEWRDDQEAGFIIMDIDDFKSLNDQYGHAFGDEVLVSLSKTFGETLRLDDVLARLGGEEFGVIITDTNKERVLHVAERLRRNAQKQVFVTDDGESPTTSISVGVTTFKKGESFNTVLKRADSALYESKEHGKNAINFN